MSPKYESIPGANIPSRRGSPIGGGAITVAGAGGDASTLSGYTASEFARLAEDCTITGAWTFNTNIALDTGVTIDGMDPSAFAALQFLVLAASPQLSAERVLTPGDGLDGNDGGAGAAYTLSVDVTDIIGTGLTEAANNIILAWSGTPDVIQPDDSAAGGASSYAARIDHTHGIVCAAPANPSVDLSASIEGSATSFARSDHEHQLDQAITPTWTGKHIFRNTTQPQVEIGYDAGGYLGITVYDGGATKLSTATDNSTGNLELEPAGYVVLDPVGNYVVPETSYDINLGAFNKKFLSLWAAELNVETLVAQEVIATIGGIVLAGPTSVLTADMGSASTGMSVKHNEFAKNDTVRLEAFEDPSSKVEFIRIDGRDIVAVDVDNDYFRVTGNYTSTLTAGTVFTIRGSTGNDGVWTVDYSVWADPTTQIVVEEDVTDGTADGHIAYRTIAGAYRYWITRNLDGTGANDWYAGDAVFNTGYTGDGFIEIYARHGIKSVDEHGPSIAGNIRKSTTYNDWGEFWAIGNLNGKYGYGTTVYGVAFGEYGVKDYITIESTNGVQFKDAAHTVRAQLTDSVWTLGNTSTEHVRISATAFQVKDGATVHTLISGGNVTVGAVGADLGNVYITAGDVALRVNEVVHILLDGSAAAITVGPVGANLSNVYITAGALSLRNNVTERIGLTAAGILTIKDSGGNAVITLDAALGAKITKKLTMPGASSAISIGETPPTALDTGTGIWIDRAGMYGLAANVLQAKFDAVTGAITAGAGVVTLDVLGISVEVTGGYVASQSYRMMEGATTIGCMYGRAGDEINDVAVQNIEQAGHAGRVIIQGESPETHSAGVVLQAVRGEDLIAVLLENGVENSFRPTPSETVDLGRTTNLWESAYINKLNVGTATGMAAGNIGLSGKLYSYDDYPNMYCFADSKGVDTEVGMQFEQQLSASTEWRRGGAVKSIATGAYTSGTATTYKADVILYSAYENAIVEVLRAMWDGGIKTPAMKTGTDQANAGAAAGELWAKSDATYEVRLGQA